MAHKSFAAGVLAASMLAGTSGCDRPNQTPANVAPQRQSAPANDAKNVFNVLSQHSFIGQDGQPVNMNALATSLQNNYSTVTFGFAECKDYCPMINNVLGELGKSNPSLTSIVIAANPQVDGASPENREAFMNRLRGDGVRHNTIILYPTEGGALSNSVVPKIAMDTGAIVNATNPLNHSANVGLYAPGGARVTVKSGMRSSSEFVNEWAPLMGTGHQR
jgi:cytochrome oxidase Cu insertion factor (SCO1/SenC/PrrC family)